MASQSSYKPPQGWGFALPNLDPDFVLPRDVIERDLGRIDMPYLDVPISRIIASTPLAFRLGVEIHESPRSTRRLISTQVGIEQSSLAIFLFSELQ